MSPKNSTKWARIQYEQLEENENENGNDKSKKKNKINKLISRNSSTKNLRRFLPWDHILKSIESKYGAGFLSLFEFVRWLFIFNLIICLITLIFIVAPQFAYKNIPYNTSIECPSSFNFASENISKECCPIFYKKDLENRTNSDSPLQIALDVFQGTGYIEKFYFFYGSYDGAFHTDNDHTYYMSLAFFSITIISLLISALTMVLRISSSFKKSVIDKIDSEGSIRFCNQVFCVWDYKLKAKSKKEGFFIKYAQATYFRFFKSCLNDVQYRKKMAELSSFKKAFLLIRRIFVNILTIALFGGAGVGFYYINNAAFEEKQRLTKSKEKEILVFVLEYIPAVTLKVFNIIFRIIFTKVEFIEDYKSSTKFTVLLFRTGFARIGSIFFLIITMVQQITNNGNVCEKQSDKYELDVFEIDSINIWCWESYVGSQLYKLVIVDFLLMLVWPFVEIIGNLFAKCKLSFLQQTFDLEGKFLNLLAVQMVFWLAIYFSPFLSVFAPLFYFATFYINLISLKYILQEENSADAKNEIHSKLNTSFFVILFIVYLLVLIMVGIIFTVTIPSSSCGPFMLKIGILEESKNIMITSVPVLFEIFDIVFSNLVLFAVCVILTSLVWIFLTYSKAYSKMSKELKKLINEEQSKNDRLSYKIKKIKKSLEMGPKAPVERNF